MYSQLLILAVLVILSAFFSGSETALISLSKSKVNELVAKKATNSGILKKLKENPHRLLITVLIGNNIVNISASAYAAVIFIDIFGSNGLGIATGIMTFVLLIFGEITPKSFAHQHAVGVSLLVAKPVYLLQLILFPLVWAFEKIVRLVNRFFGVKKDYTVTEEELVAMLKIGAQEGSIEKQERELIENVLEFNDIDVEQVMTPRVAIEAMSSELSIQEAVDSMKKFTHTRIPIYKGDLDHIIGIINVKELLGFFDECHPSKKLKSLDLSMPIEVPLSKKIDKLFREFQRKHSHIAIIIDKFGGTAGLVTMEDLLEEIVGEIVDETDLSEKPIEIVDSKNIIVTGEVLLEDVNDFFKVKFWPDDHDSVNKVIYEKLERFPREDDVIKFPMGKMTVLQVKKHLVKKAKVTFLRRLR